MKILLVVLVILVLLAFFWFLYRTFYVKQKSRKRAEQKLKIFAGLLHKLRTDENISSDELVFLAENPATRHPLFGILKGFGRTELFPENYHTLEKSAESFLVNWLEFPTELNAPPDRIELFTTITVEEDQEILEYFVFKYKKESPPYGLTDAWMLGVAGPFKPDSKPYEIPLRVFSRFNELGTVTAAEEVRWVHDHINRRG